MNDPTKPCPTCGAAPGQLHAGGCTVERCPYCGKQLFSCCCDDSLDGVPDDDRMPWSGEYPGVAECRAFGWFARPGPAGWAPCGQGEPGAREDLNRLYSEAVWDREQRRWVLRE